MQRTAKTIDSLCGCTGWSETVVFAHAQTNQFFISTIRHTLKALINIIGWKLMLAVRNSAKMALIGQIWQILGWALEIGVEKKREKKINENTILSASEDWYRMTGFSDDSSVRESTKRSWISYICGKLKFFIFIILWHLDYQLLTFWFCWHFWLIRRYNPIFFK